MIGVTMNGRHVGGIFLRIAVITALLLGAGCGGSQPEAMNGRERIRITGSDTMLRLTQRWAEEFMRRHPGVTVTVEGGGTELGVRALVEGSTDFASASRPIPPEAVAGLAREYRSLGFSVLTARDALCFYTHMDNPVASLTTEQLAGIFSGRITDWSEVGGDPAPIRVLSRDPNSGTHAYLEEHLLQGGAVTERATVLSGTATIVREVSRDVHAIGYGGLAYGENVYDLDVNGVAPFSENVRNGRYPVSRYLYLYAIRPPEGVQKRFVDWVLGPEGQRIVQEVGYVPLYDGRPVRPIPRPAGN
ncbi:MAG: phosphate ABC transporter substrate-binding protein [Bacteroidetes bacterium]|jgi:phosphate transport system substrate-binding protein|nr:phosphate ABC transporter substrate-binding protein [Bacteroidota bacterium]